jgi:hypothetical protein
MFLVKLINLGILNGIISNIIRDNFTISTLFNITRNIIIVLTITHIIACIFLYLSIYLSKFLEPENTWIGNTLIYAGKEATVYTYLFQEN